MKKIKINGKKTKNAVAPQIQELILKKDLISRNILSRTILADPENSLRHIRKSLGIFDNYAATYDVLDSVVFNIIKNNGWPSIANSDDKKIAIMKFLRHSSRKAGLLILFDCVCRKFFDLGAPSANFYYSWQILQKCREIAEGVNVVSKKMTRLKSAIIKNENCFRHLAKESGAIT